MSFQRPHLVYYKDKQHPHVVIFQNPDGSWGEDGDLEMFLGLDRGKRKSVAHGSSSQREAYEDLVMEAAFNEEKFEICRKALVELRDKHESAAQTCNIALQKVEDVPWGEEPGAAAHTERVVVEVSEDGLS